MGTKKRNRVANPQSDNSDHVRHPRHRSLGLHRQRQDPPPGGGRRRCSCNVVPWPVRRAVLQPLLLDQLLQPGRAIRPVRELGEHEHRLQLARHHRPPWPPTNRIHLNPLRVSLAAAAAAVPKQPPPPPLLLFSTSVCNSVCNRLHFGASKQN